MMKQIQLAWLMALPLMTGCSGVLTDATKSANTGSQAQHQLASQAMHGQTPTLLLKPPTEACAPRSQLGQWIVPTANHAGKTTALEVLAAMKTQQVVLLGEQHDSAEDHRWQLQVLTQLHSQHQPMAVGFEMFPRRLQSVLNQWVAGELSESEFRKQSEWDKVWGYEWEHYAPLFHYARMNQIPMLALNVERTLVNSVGQQGFSSVPDAQREGVTQPATPPQGYLDALRSVFSMHPDKAMDEAAFMRFVEAQTVWDRAMAQIMSEYLKHHPQAQVVGIMGSGHVRNGYGVAHQLKNLGVEKTGLLMTWERTDSCKALGNGLADALYLVEAPKSSPPRMGVGIQELPQGLKITSITSGSIAEAADLKVGDVIVEVAGQAAKNFALLRSAIQRQAPGTWMPLKIKRNEQDIDIVARFPVTP